MSEHESEKDREDENEDVQKESETDYESWKEGKSKLKNVTIRGIDSEIYDQFSHKIRSLRMNLGEAITKMMNDILVDLNDSLDHLPALRARTTFDKYALDRLSINHYDRLKIGRADLEEANAKITFTHIDRLTFLPDVTQEVFSRYVRSVSHCGTVRMPSIFPKLIAYSKLQFCDRIEIYDVKDEEAGSTNSLVKD
ncbi:MAG: hypothetical protein JSW11_02725 [Candidatus Heimdallarchaeota archaeon]|nr:MAG: hypothetical protein JSW11_02725 [Candidatus Heimdallarchaeota archaeon]